jgi:hypothetical protein
LLQMPAQIARELVGLDAHAIKMKIDAAIREALTELSDLPLRVTDERCRLLYSDCRGTAALYHARACVPELTPVN